MSSLRVKAAGILLAILVVSMDFTPHILLARLFAQQQSYEDFLNRLENYLKGAIPPESDPVKECEYIAPEGFNPSLAERLWRSLAPFISLGCSEQALKENLSSIYHNDTIPVEANGNTVALNLTNLKVEKPPDGSVRVKIPVVSDRPLNYTYYNSTNVRILYETWNETLVRYYRVEKYTGLYRYVFKDLKYGTVFDVVSKLAVRTFPGFELEDCVFFPVKKSWGDWGYFMANPVIAVPGHYEEVSVVIPRQEVNYRVLFPAYDPVYTPSSEKPWRVNTNISSTSLSTGEILKIGYWAEYMPYEPMMVKSLNDGEEEPLNATLTLEATDAFQPLSSTVRVLDNNHSSGFFELRAVKQGLHNITLKLEGNARFSLWPGGQELVYTVQTVGPTSPSVSFTYTLDPSLLKHARLTLELSNNGGSTARSVLVEMWGEYAESVSRMVGDIEVGEIRREVFTIGLSNPSSPFNIKVSYFDDEGNKYVAETLTGIWTNLFVVPEHYEDYTVVIPEHEETRMVFIPDAEYYTHVRLYRLTFIHEVLGFCAHLPTVNGHYSGVELNLVSHLTFTGIELNASDFESDAAYKDDMVMLDLEPYWESLGVFEEENATRILDVDPSMLRANQVPEGYRASLVGETWVSSRSIIMDATEFVIYNQTISKYIMENKLQGEFRIGCRKFTNATRFSEPSGETGFLTLIYHPLSVKGSGPLKSIQVRNYHGCNLSYRLRVYRYEVSYGAPLGQPPRPSLWENFTSPFNVASLGDSVLLASSLASEGYSYHIQLLLGSIIVAEAYFDLYPEPSPFWAGFWDGLKSQWLKIVLTGAAIIILNVATGGTVGSLALKLTVLAVLSSMILINALSQYQELGQIIFASHTFNEFKSIMEEHAREFESLGYLNTASIFKRAAGDIQRLVEAIRADLPYWPSILDFVSRVCTDMSLEEWMILIGLKDAEPYTKGFVWGKAIGNAISLVEFLIGFCHLATSGATSASLGAKAKAVLQGVWNWLTPSLTDALSVIRNSPKLAKGFSMLLTIFSNAKKLGYSIIDVLKMDTRGAMNLAGISGGLLEKITELAKKREISDDVAKAIMELCSKATELGEDALGKLNGDMKTILSKNAKFAGEFSSWALRTEANLKWVVETARELSELDGEELKGLGEALAKVGDSFENGVKLFDTYFKITDDSIKNYFLDTIENAKENIPKILDTWLRVIPENGFVLTVKEYSDGQRFIHLPKFIADAYSIKQGDIITVIIDDIRVTGVVYEYEEGGLAVALRKGASNILNIKEGTPLGIVTSKVLALVTEDEGFTVSALGEKGSRVDRAITDILRKLNAFESRGGSVILVEVQRISGDNTLIPETRRDLRLWKPDRYIKLPVDDWDGPFYVRIKPFTVDDMENALSIVRDGSGNPLIIRQGDGFKFFEQDLDFEYNDRGMLRAVLDVSGTQRKIAIDIYCNEQYEVDTKFAILESDLWYNAKKYQISDKKVFTISNGKRVLNKMVRVIEFEYSSKNNLLMLYYDPDENALRPFKIGAPAQYDDYYRVTRDAISFLEDKVPSICFEGESGSIEIYIHGFEEHHKYLRSILNSQGEGVFATQIIQIGLKKAGLRTIIDITGENIEFEGIIYYFDIMDDPNRITLAIEAKSEWSESHPGRGLENAAKQLVKHAEKLKNSERLATDHGYAVYISIFPDKIEIHWKRVNIEG